MSLTAGQQAMIARIINMPGRPNLVLPAGPAADCPRYVVQEAGGAQRTVGLDGHTDSTPEIIVRVETNTKYSVENAELVAALVALFRPGDRFDGVTIIDAPLPRPALPTTRGIYAVPIRIRGQYSF
ncbi:hypothetical protein [Pseudooceanicola atlanticus]|nr:hypothetical protein [Pseudooceanicola atlanticus]